MKKGDFLPLFKVKSPNFRTSDAIIKSINSCLYCSIFFNLLLSAGFSCAYALLPAIAAFTAPLISSIISFTACLEASA